MVWMHGRRLVLMLCRALGLGTRVLRRPLAVTFELLLISAAAVWLVAWLGELAGLEAAAGWFGADTVLFVWGVVLIGWRIVLARRRLVIEKFEDHTGGEAVEGASGLGVLLAVELAGINRLFDVVEGDEQLPPGDSGLESFQATVEGGGVSQLLQNSVSAESKLSLGPFAIPVGTILGIFSRIVQGPRLVGHVHRDGDRRIITLQMTGEVRTWRYQDSAEVGADGSRTWPAIDEVVNDLACRILVDQARCGTGQHRAFRHLVTALRAYRTGVQIGRQRTINLRRAEHELSAALAVDPSFDLAFYNLGVVYTRLGQLDAAGIAFQRAVALDNRRWSAYYALARNHYERAIPDGTPRAEAEIHLLKTIDYCERAFALAPTGQARSQVLIQKAVGLFRYGIMLDSAQIGYDAVTTGRRAASKAWRTLCRAELAGASQDRRERSRRFASDCLQAFARMVTIGLEASRNFDLQRSALQTWWIQQTALAYLRLARHLAPWDASICFDLGKAYLELGKAERAATELRRACRMDPTATGYLGHLALAQAQAHRVNDVRDTYRRVLERLATVPAETRDAMVAALRVIEGHYEQIHGLLAEARAAGEGPRRNWARLRILPRFFGAVHRLSGRRLALFSIYSARLTPLIRDARAADLWLATQKQPLQEMTARLAAQEEFRTQLAQACEKPVSLGRLEQMLEEKKSGGLRWEAGEVARCLAGIRREGGDLDGALDSLRAAIELFGQDNRSELSRRGLHGLLSRYLRQAGRLDEAIEAAREGLRLDPVGHYERDQLAWCHVALEEYEQAIAAWEEALLWAPESAVTHYCVGICHTSLHDSCRDPEKQRRHLEAAIRSLLVAVELHAGDTESQNEVRYFLAGVYSQAGRHREAIAEYRSLRARGYHPLVMTHRLADAYLSDREPQLADACCRELLAEVTPKLADPEVELALPGPAGEVYTLDVMALFGHLGRAYTRMEMELPLEACFASIREARALLERVEDPAVRDNWRSACDRIEGSLLFKVDRLDEAIARLEAAVSATAEAESHYYLAASILRKIQRDDVGDAATALRRRAGHHLQEAGRRDRHGEFSDRLARLREELVALTPPVRPAARAASGSDAAGAEA